MEAEFVEGERMKKRKPIPSTTARAMVVGFVRRNDLANAMGMANNGITRDSFYAVTFALRRAIQGFGMSGLP